MVKIYLEAILNEEGMTQSQLAQKTDIRPATIHEMCKGTAERINLKHLARICDTLGVCAEHILHYDPYEEDEELNS